MKRTHNMTLSFPKQVIARMHKFVHKGQISKFTTEVVTKALDELEKQREQELEVAYETASNDKEREADAKEWSESDNKDVEGWEWKYE